MTKQRLCPICKKPRDHALKQQSGSAQENPFTPFCSQRCKDRDLAQWFGDGYALPGERVNPEDIAASDWGNDPDRQE